MSQNNIAATITKTDSPVTVIRDGQILLLNQGDSVYATDTIRTQNTPVEISFRDGATAVLSPETSMTVQEFSFDTGEAPSFVLNLAHGAMRSISGEVVAQNPDAFKVVTPKATAGIRGTDYFVQVNADGSEAYVVFSLDQGHNLVITVNDGGQISLTMANQGAFIGAGDNNQLTPYTFSDEELEELVSRIAEVLAALREDDELGSDDEKPEDGEDSSESDDTTSLETLELDQSLTEVLTDDSVNDLLLALSDEDIDASLETAAGNLDYGDDDEVLVDTTEDSGGGGGDVEFDDGFIDVEALGDAPYFADTDVDVVADVRFKNHNVNITSNMNVAQDQSGNDVIISGDAKNVTAGVVRAGSDIIAGLDASEGRVVGDANEVTGGTVISGNDTITLNNKTGGNSIYGDAFSVANAEVTFGHDSIRINSALANTTVSGDVNTIQGSTINAWGNDTISIGGDVTNATIYGDYNDPDATEGGNDVINIAGSLNSGSVSGGFGTDSIRIGTNNAASIDAGLGNDTVRVVGTHTGTIAGKDGDDQIIIGTANTGSAITGGDGDDHVTIGTYSGGDIDGGANAAGGDTLTINNVSGTLDYTKLTNFETLNIKIGNGTINGSDVAGDAISLNNLNGGTINGLGGADDLSVTTMNSGSINGGDDDDNISVTTMSGGTINGGAGSDEVSISGATITGTIINVEDVHLIGDMKGGTLAIDGNVGVEITKDGTNAFNMSGGTIDSGAGDDTFNLGTLSSNAKINGEDGNDSVVITTMSNGTVNGGGDDDDITVTTMSDGTIDGGADDDKVSITNTAITGTISNVEDVRLSGGMTGGTLTIDGSVGAAITKDGVDSFDMSGGTINGGSGADTFSLGTLSNAAKINGGAGSDSVEITTMNSGTVNGGADDDKITVTTMSGGSIDGGAGSDEVSITNTAITGTISNVEDVRLSGGMDSGTLTIDGSVGAEITKDGTDGFDMSGGTIDGSAHVDTILVNSMSGGSINGGAENDEITITTMDAGFVYGDAGADEITITTMDAGYVSGGAGADTITIDTLNAGHIVGGTGNDDSHANDRIVITNQVNTGNILNLAARNIHLTGGMNSGTMLLYGAAGVILTKDGTDGFDMSGGDIYGSTGADSFKLSSFTAGDIDGDDGNDTLEITADITADLDFSSSISNIENVILSKVDGVTVTTSDDIEKITIDEVNDGIIKGGTGEDTLYITDLSGANNKFENFTKIYIENALAPGVDYTVVGGAEVFIGGQQQGNKESQDTMQAGDDMTGTEFADIFTIKTWTGGTVTTLGSGDIINVTNEVASGTTQTVINSAGLDSVRLVGGMSDGEISLSGTGTFYVTGQDDNTGFNMDGGTIIGSAQADTFNLARLTSGTINGGGGEDSIVAKSTVMATIDLKNANSIENFDFTAIGDNGYVIGTAAAETFTVGTMTGTAKIDGGIGGDNITVNDFISGEVYTGVDEDTLTIDTLENLTTGKIINSGAEADTIYLKNGPDSGTLTLQADSTGGFKVYGTNSNTGFSMAGGAVLNGSDKADTLLISTMTDDGTNKTIIRTDDGDDSITAGGMTGSSILAGEGSDTIHITGDVRGVKDVNQGHSSVGSGDPGADAGTTNYITIDGTVDYAAVGGGDGVDIIKVGAVTGNATNTSNISGYGGNDTIEASSLEHGFIYGGAGENNITVGTLFATGEIQGGDDADTITVTTLNGGTINSGDGVDSITVTNMNGGTIDSGVGADILTLGGLSSNAFSATVINNGSGVDQIYLGYSLGNNSNQITIQGSSGVELRHDASSWFQLNGKVIVDGTGQVAVSTVNPDGIIEITNNTGGNINIINHAYGTLTGGDGDDNISIGGYFGVFSGFTVGGILSAGAGDDTITIGNSVNNGGKIDGGAGDDSITIEDVQNATINGGIGGDTIDITGSAFNITVDGGGDATQDTLSIGGTLSGTTNHFENLTKVEIDSLGSGAKYTTTNVGEVWINGALQGKTETIALMEDGDVITGTSAVDTFTVTTFNGGTIQTLEGADNITIENNFTSTNAIIENSGTGVDNIIFNGNFGAIGLNPIITLNATGDGGFVVSGDSAADSKFYFVAGTINGSKNADKFNIGTSQGSINAGEGNDTINIETFNAGTISTGAGGDEVSLNEFASTAAEKIINNLSGKDSVFFTSDINNAYATLKLEGADFYVSGRDAGGNDVGANVLDGTIQSGDGSDSFVFGTMDGTLNGGGGTDTVTISDTEIYGTISNVEDIRLSNGMTDGYFNIIGNTKLTADGTNGFNMSGGTLNGDVSDSDIIINTMSGGEIYNWGGDDTVTISDSAITGDIYKVNNIYLTNGMASGALELGSDNGFTLSKNGTDGFAMSGGTINEYSGADDTFIISTMTGGVVNAGSGDDKITLVGSVQMEIGDKIETGFGDDSIYIEKQLVDNEDIAIYNTFGTDSIFIEAGMGGTTTENYISFYGEGSYVIWGADNTTGVDISNGRLSFNSKGTDNVNIDEFSGGIVSSNNDDGNIDIINIATWSAPDMAGGNNRIIMSSQDKLTITHVTDEIWVDDIDGGSYIITNIEGADTVYGGTSNDIVNVENFAGTISAGGGADTITVTSWTAGEIQTGAGHDSITIKNAITNNVTLSDVSNSVEDSDKIFLENGLNGGTLNLEATGGKPNSITVYGVDENTGFNMTGGTINGSVESDSLTLGTISGNATINTGGGSDSIYLTADFSGGNDHLTINNDSSSNNANVYLKDGVTMTQGSITLTANDNAGFYLYGENATLAGGSIHGSSKADAFEIGTMTNGTINLNAGNDGITVFDTMTGGTINAGDDQDTILINHYTAGFIDGGASSFDKLTITDIDGNTDVSDITNIETITFVNVDSNDTIDASGVTLAAGGVWEDVTIENMNGGTFTGKAGQIVTVENLYGTNNNFTGITELHITNLGPGATYNAAGITVKINGEDVGITQTQATLADSETFSGSAGVDQLTVTTWTGGTIASLASSDNIVIENKLSGGNYTINNSAGTDRVYLQGGMSAGTLTLTASGAAYTGNDAFYLYGKDNTQGFDFSGGTIEGSAFDDLINISTMSGTATINANDGVDTITIDTITKGTINGGSGDNVYIITNISASEDDSLKIIDAGGNNSFEIEIFNDGSIDTAFGSDNFTITTMNGGSIDAGDSGGAAINVGNVFKITNMNDGTITDYEGASTFNITNALKGVIKTGGGADSINISDVVNSTDADIVIEHSGAEYVTMDINSMSKGKITLKVINDGTGGFVFAENAYDFDSRTPDPFELTGGHIIVDSKGNDTIAVGVEGTSQSNRPMIEFGDNDDGADVLFITAPSASSSQITVKGFDAQDTLKYAKQAQTPTTEEYTWNSNVDARDEDGAIISTTLGDAVTQGYAVRLGGETYNTFVYFE